MRSTSGSSAFRSTLRFIPGSNTKDIYDRKYNQLVQRRIEINELLEQHHEGNENFKIAATALVTLTSKASDIFDCSTTEEKRQLISYVFSNLELEGSKLVYTLKTPFNLFVDIGKCQKWLPEQDSNILKKPQKTATFVWVIRNLFALI